MEADDELRRLRARAYGPDADIADDAAALARLEELESARRAPTAVIAPAAEQVAPAGESPIAVEGASEAVARDIREPEASPTGETAVPPVGGWRGWSQRRTAVVAAIVLVAVVVVAVGATTFVTRRTGYTAPVAAVLTPRPDREVPSIYGMTSDASTVFADFAGVTAFSTDVAWTGADVCLLVAETARLDEATPNSFPGFATTGCGAGPFPATVTFIVGPDAPDAMREHYADGTALQFVLEGDEVVVLAAPAASRTPVTERDG